MRSYIGDLTPYILEFINGLAKGRSTNKTRPPANIQDGELCNNSQRLWVINYCSKTLHLKMFAGVPATPLRGVGHLNARFYIIQSIQLTLKKIIYPTSKRDQAMKTYLGNSCMTLTLFFLAPIRSSRRQDICFW